MSDLEILHIDSVKTAINSNKLEGHIGYKYQLSGIIVQATLYLLSVLSRSE